MPRIKSLVTRVEIDEAKHAHNCQANVHHRIEQGHKRLKVRNGRSWDHYCVECARVILRRDAATVNDLLRLLDESALTTSAVSS
jgi:hypothetical protein